MKPVDHLHNSGGHFGFACTSCVDSIRESPGLQARWHRLAHVCSNWWNLLEQIEHVLTTLGTRGRAGLLVPYGYPVALLGFLYVLVGSA